MSWLNNLVLYMSRQIPWRHLASSQESLRKESLDALRKAVEISSEANNLYMVAMRAHHNLGTMLRAWLGDNETAMAISQGAELGRLRGVAAEELRAVASLSYIGCLFGPGRLKEIGAELPPDPPGSGRYHIQSWSFIGSD